MTRTVAGLVPFTSIDYPSYLAAVIFFQGCPLRCPFCHNPNLQPAQGENLTPSVEVMTFLKGRVKRLDGVVFSGGEPLMQTEIAAMIQEVKALGFKVAIHTSGVYVDTLRDLLPLLDWVGLDIKAPWAKYETLTGRKGVAEKVQKSLRYLIESGVKFECRTTCDPLHLTPDEVIQIAKELKQAGVATYALQKYRSFPEDKHPPSVTEIEAFFTHEVLRQITSFYPEVILR